MKRKVLTQAFTATSNKSFIQAFTPTSNKSFIQAFTATSNKSFIQLSLTLQINHTFAGFEGSDTVA
jgi:hypothetical protein